MSERERGWLGGGLIAISVLLPLSAALVTRPVLYDGQRHFLFILPPLAAGAGCALHAFLRPPVRVRAAGAAVWLGCAPWVAVQIVRLHPYEYVYFNASIGGLRGAVGRYETDYWG